MKAKVSHIGLAIILLVTITGVPLPPVEAAAKSPPITSEDTINAIDSGESISLEVGTEISVLIINGPPEPPPEYATEREALLVSADNIGTRGTLASFPSYSWVFGCSAVSQAMIAGYYDNNGYPDMYTGSTNSGLMPISDMVAPYTSTYVWGTWFDGSVTYPSNPLVASQDGVDGRTTYGSIDDYWVGYNSPADDPYITGAWTQHTWGTAVGDYMKTSQSAYFNVDGSTNFYLYESNVPLTCSDMEFYGIQDLDGTYGRKLFYEARGYTVTDCYFQQTDNQYSGGFSLADFQAEIDAGHPVMLGLTGHSVVGFGYSGSTIYIRDTWDSNPSNIYSMVWGTNYLGMDLMGASVVNLAPSTSPPGAYSKTNPTNGATGESVNPTLSWGISTGASEYEYCYDDTDDSSCTVWASTGLSTSVGLSGLNAATTYYWQVRATNAHGTTYANGSETSYWSFTTEGLPGAFSKSSPSNGVSGESIEPILSWETSNEADEYELCIDTVNNGLCDDTWIPTGTSTMVLVSGLSSSTTYYWHVRANNSVGTTYTNGNQTAYWSFTTEGIPGQFGKISPADWAIDVSTSPTLSWESSTEADEYMYCYDEIDNAACDTEWVSTGMSTSVGLSGLDPSTTYFWQVLASNSVGGVYANTSPSAYWEFTTADTSDVFLPLIMK